MITHKKTLALLFSTTHYLPSNDGLASGTWCQQRGIHLLANDNNLSGPVISFSGGRLPLTTAVFICSSLIAVNHQSYAQYMQLSLKYL